MRGFVCYLEREATGLAIRRVRLVGPEMDQTWTSPAAPERATPAPAEGAESSRLVADARTAARWVADELEDVRQLAAVVADADGGRCWWLTAPSAETRVVAAALQQSLARGDGGSTGAEVGGMLEGAGDPASGVSVQALAIAEARPAPSIVSRLRHAPAAANGAAPRPRLAVVTLPDAPVRVFLDELDTLRVEAAQVLSLWHAMGVAWEPGRPARRDEGGEDSDRVVSTQSPASAIVMVDPGGRLVWSWSRDGELLAAGSMRIRQVPPLDRQHAAPPPGDTAFGPVLSPPETGAPPLLEQELAARRVADTASPVPVALDEGPTLDCGKAEIGRLVMDWLAWSAQLGASPERIVCVGPLDSVSAAGAGGAGAGGTGSGGSVSIAEALGLAWPGAVVDAAVLADPIGAMLTKLRQALEPPRKGARAEKGAPEPPHPPHSHHAPDRTDDPRSTLVELTRRPGRASRRMYRWASAAILGAAAATAIFGWRVGQGAASAKQRLEEIRTRRAEMIKSAESYVPALSLQADPVGRLMAKAAEVRDRNAKLVAIPPVVQEVVTVVDAMAEFEGIHLTEIGITDISARVVFSVPTDQIATIGPAVLNKLAATGNMTWKGDAGNISGDRRTYILTSIAWNKPADKPSARAGP